MGKNDEIKEINKQISSLQTTRVFDYIMLVIGMFLGICGFGIFILFIPAIICILLGACGVSKRSSLISEKNLELARLK